MPKIQTSFQVTLWKKTRHLLAQRKASVQTMACYSLWHHDVPITQGDCWMMCPSTLPPIKSKQLDIIPMPKGSDSLNLQVWSREFSACLAISTKVTHSKHEAGVGQTCMEPSVPLLLKNTQKLKMYLKCKGMLSLQHDYMSSTLVVQDSLPRNPNFIRSQALTTESPTSTSN